VHSDRGGSYQVWLVDPDGAQYTQVTQSGGAKIYPFWAPDGSRRGTLPKISRGLAARQSGAGAGPVARKRGLPSTRFTAAQAPRSRRRQRLLRYRGCEPAPAAVRFR
jgi:hypothetical protein